MTAVPLYVSMKFWRKINEEFFKVKYVIKVGICFERFFKELFLFFIS